MKSIISLFIIIFLSSSCKGQNNSDHSENGWFVNRLVGKVKQTKESMYDGDDMDKTIKGTLETNYNEDGYITQIYSNGAYEETDPTTTKVYDRNNKLIKTIFYDSNNNELEKITYIYSKGGKEIDKKIESKESNMRFSEKVILKYDNANQLLGGQTINDGSIKYKDSFKYLYDKTGNWIKKTQFKYDEISTVTERKIEYF